MMNTVEIICEAWRGKKPELLEDILADKFIWYETPYDEPITHKEKLLDMWKHDLKGQTDIQVTATTIVDANSLAIANWQASFKRFDSLMEMDGIFIIKTDDNGKMIEFRQWWITK